MRPIKLPQLSGGFSATPELFQVAIRRAIVIGNGFAGAENQCIGLVRALGLSHRHSLYRVTRPRGRINKWLHWLPVSLHKKLNYVVKRICGDSLFQSKQSDSKYCAGLLSVIEADTEQIAAMARETFDKDGPLLVVASGRDTIHVASSIKRLAPENVFVVQIQHPRAQLDRFDLVITPRHDYYPLTPEARKQIPWFLRRWITPREPPDRHVILTVGALHQADSAALRSAASTWHDVLSPLPKPLLVVNIGGTTGNCHYGLDLAKTLTDMLQNVLWSCGSVRISFSRRTPEKVSKILVKAFSGNPKVYIWGREGPNPHLGHLAWADAFVITADSVSMLSEACSTGKPVYVIGAERCTWKFSDFQRSLLKQGVVRLFTGKEDISETWSYSPLNDAAEAARQVNQALAERGWMKKSRKIPMMKCEEPNQRSVTFAKRRTGLFSKAAELCTLFDGVQYSILVKSTNHTHNGNVHSFGNDSVFESFLNDAVPQPVDHRTGDSALAPHDQCRSDHESWREIESLDFDSVDSVEELCRLEEKIKALKENVKNKIDALTHGDHVIL